jgi:glucose-6-phosphate isomerase
MQQMIKQMHATQKHVLLIIISKSGSTIETIANAAVLLQQFSAQYIKDSVICITDAHSLLDTWAKKNEVQTLYIPQAVGGRFSVFTAVGLFPLACLGIDIVELCEGASTYDWTKDDAALRAEWLCNAVQRNIPIHDLFLTASDAHSLGLWYRQLMGETIGKKRIKDNTIAAIGIMPTVSLCSADLHSVGQLYIAGPDVRVTTFVTIPACKTISITLSDIVTMVNPVLHNKSINQTLDAIAQGTMQTYAQHNLNYTHIHFPEKSAFCIGQFMYMAMVEMIYLAQLLDINPFDQPEVELYKQATREFLAK